MKYSEMTKKEVEELQNSLLELVPNNIRNSKELTRSSKVLLGNFIFLNGMDKAKENGYVFRSNKLLEDDTKLSNKTIIKNISKLIQLGFITRSTGNRVDGASTYILNYEILNSYQGCNFKGVKSEENYTYKLHPLLEEKINSMSLEIKELKNMVKELIGVISDMGVKINYTTDTDIDPEINKKYNIHVNIHDNINTGNNISEVINKNKFIKNDVNNINTGNSDVEIKDLKIEENINLNKENVMNEERVNEMNDRNNSTLEERLGTQPLDDNTTGNFKNTGNKYPQEEQERYHRLFNNCKSQIEIWMKTHEYSCISIFDSYFKVIQYMHQTKTISDKQWEAAQHYLLQRFMNLRNGYSNYVQNKKKTISSMELNEYKSPQPPRQQNDQMEDAV